MGVSPILAQNLMWICWFKGLWQGALIGGVLVGLAWWLIG